MARRRARVLAGHHDHPPRGLAHRYPGLGGHHGPRPRRSPAPSTAPCSAGSSRWAVRSVGGYTQAFVDGRRVVGLGEPMGTEPAPPPGLVRVPRRRRPRGDRRRHRGGGRAGDRARHADHGLRHHGDLRRHRRGRVRRLAARLAHRLGRGRGARRGRLVRGHGARPARRARVLPAGVRVLRRGPQRTRVRVRVGVPGRRAARGRRRLRRAGRHDAPAAWTLYFAVTDTDASAAQVTELGGTVVSPPTDTPFGRMAIAAGPFGEVFALMGPVVGA